MAKNLLIVESPAKAKTINKYLGTDFHVLASYGHVRDLVPKEGAVDTDHNFAMNYEVIERNEKHVAAIAKAAASAEAVYLGARHLGGGVPGRRRGVLFGARRGPRSGRAKAATLP